MSVARLLTLPEAAHELRISERNAYRLVKLGTFPVPVVKVGSQYRVPSGPVEALKAGVPWEVAS